MHRRDFFKVLGSFMAVAAAERLVLVEAAEVMERRLPVAAEMFGPMRGVAYGCRIDWA